MTIKSFDATLDPTGDPWRGMDGPTLLATASTLQLNPQNISWLLRLQRLASIAATLPEVPSARMPSPWKIQKLLSLQGINDRGTEHQQDPYEGVYIVEIPSPAGPRLTIQGLATNAGIIAQSLLNAILLSPRELFPEIFLEKVKTLANILLNVSDIVCKNFNLTRHTKIDENIKKIKIPSPKKLSEATKLVEFDENEIFSNYSESMREYLTEKLVQQQGCSVPRSVDPVEWIIIHPFIRCKTHVTLAAPTELAATLRHHIVSAAIEEDCIDQLVNSLLLHSTLQTKKLVQHFVDFPLETVEKEGNWIHLKSSFDFDKVIEIFVIIDDLKNYDKASIYGEWNSSDTFISINNIISKKRHSETTLYIFTPLSIGREFTIFTPPLEGSCTALVASYDELQTILQTPGFNKLGLWYFSRALSRLCKHTKVIPCSSHFSLDTFALYYENNMSFCLEDSPLQNFLAIECAYGQDLRLKNAARYDHRYFELPGQDEKGCAEGWLAHPGTNSPVYLSCAYYNDSYVVDLKTVIVWVHVLRQKDTDDTTETHLMVIGEALAYWIWQLWELEPQPLEQAASTKGVVEYAIELTPTRTELDSRLCNRTSDTSAHVLEVFFLQNLPTTKNEMDRFLVSELCRTLGIESTQIIDQVLRRGAKDLICLGSCYQNSSIPAWMCSDEALSELLDELGQYLTEDKKLPIGTIEDEERSRLIISYITPWLIDKLYEEVSELAPTNLIEFLIERNEALITYWIRESERLTHHTAPFENENDEIFEVQKQLVKSDTSLLASRFLIEFVAAFPPSGTKVLNQERYEKLMALGSEVINKGMLADSLKSEISNVHFKILASGRLSFSFEDDTYFDALNAFRRSRAESILADSSLPQAEKQTQQLDFPVVNDLAGNLFGFTFTELEIGVHVLVDLLGDSQTRTIPSSILKDELSKTLKWQDSKIESFLKELTMPLNQLSREVFWRDTTNVAPWRFNRDRSYLKRPLVQHKEGISFGRKALLHIPLYWIEQYRSGRLQKPSDLIPERKQAWKSLAEEMGRSKDIKGKNFEKQVADVLREVGYSIVKERVDRIGNYSLHNFNGKDLGDIDVLAINPDKHELLLVEAKNLEVARTPAELRNEVKQLAVGEKSALRRLKERASWVRTHLEAILRSFNVSLSNKAKWNVKSIIVVDQKLLSESLFRRNVSIVALKELRSYI